MRCFAGRPAEWTAMGLALLRREYPPFVIRGYWEGDIPVFTYHAVDPDELMRGLDYLRQNGYTTLVTDEILDILRSRRPWPWNAVVLTFDDGLIDLYETAYPLLCEYGFRAIAFVSPYWVGEPGVITWDQMQAMHASGVIDFQSHSYTHAQVPVSIRIDDFYHPGLAYRFPWDLPLWDLASGLPAKHPAWGMPIFRALPGLSDRPAVWMDPSLVDEMITHVRNAGGERFFQSWGWKRRLKRLYFDLVRSRPVRKETPQEQARRIRDDLVLGKIELEKRLPSKRVGAFAYPHHLQGRLCARLLRETGYSLVFDGIHTDVGFGDPSQGFFYIKRVHADFIRRLPGKGKKRFVGILWTKARRSLQGRQTR